MLQKEKGNREVSRRRKCGGAGQPVWGQPVTRAELGRKLFPREWTGPRSDVSL